MSAALVESLILLAALLTGYVREKTRWRKADKSVTATLVAFAFVALGTAFVTDRPQLFVLSLLLFSHSLDPLHRGTGPLSQHRLTRWLARLIDRQAEEGRSGLQEDLVELPFRFLSLGIWLFAITQVSDGLVFRLLAVMSLCGVVGWIFQVELKTRMDMSDRNYRDAYSTRELSARILVIAALSVTAAICGQAAWIPCIGFIAAWSFHFYVLQRFVGSTYRTVPISHDESSGSHEFLLEPQGFITTGTIGGIAHRISALVFIAYAVGVLNFSPPILRTLMLAVAGLAGSVLAIVTMLGILALQGTRCLGMPRSQFARGLQGFALSFVVLLAASLAAALFLPDEMPNVASGRIVMGGQTLLALALLIYVLTSIPRDLVYFLSLVWDILRPITQSENESN